MSEENKNLLEPRLTEEQCKEKMVRYLLQTKPDIVKLSKPSVLDQVKTFLPKMAEAEEKMNQDLKEGLRDKYDIENVDADDKVVEMDVAMVQENEEWTSDSEPDSTPSQTCNDFTSDTDVSSTTPCSSSSNSPETSPRRSPDRDLAYSRKRPLLQEIEEDQKMRKTGDS